MCLLLNLLFAIFNDRFFFQSFYYFAIIEDLILRWSWALGFYLTENKYVNGEVMQSVLAPLEVFRYATVVFPLFLTQASLSCHISAV